MVERVDDLFTGTRIVDAPVLLLVSFHKAFRAELADLHDLTTSSLEIGNPGRDLILDLLRRFRFLQLAYKYHTAAEDELIFRALDVRVRNVTYLYSLEHRRIDSLFDSVFRILNALLEVGGNLSEPFQELVFTICTIQASICHHMLKEEEQVIPLLIQWFSFKEQASLVWQFICSVPITLLEDFFPWMISYLPTNEQADVALGIQEVVPKEKALQEVVMSWLSKKLQSSFKSFNTKENGKGFRSSNEPLKKELPGKKSLSGGNFSGDVGCLENNDNYHPIDGLHLWHGAIEKDLRELLEELHEIRRSRSFSTLPSVSGQLKFFADVLIFYSDALEKNFFSVVNELASGCLTFSYHRFPDDSHIEGLFHALQDLNSQSGLSLCNLVEKLCWHLVSFLEGINKHFAFQESKVFPLIRKHCNYEMQRRLLYTSLHIMPLGLLKCVITWLSTHLSEDESKAILSDIKLAESGADMSFASLLHEWICTGYSGKTSLGKFREELQDMFKNRGSLLLEEVKEKSGFSMDLMVNPSDNSQLGQMNTKSSDKAKSCSSDIRLHNVEDKYSTLYSSGINLQILFPAALKILSPIRAIPKFLIQTSDTGCSINPEPKPIDFIFLFHKALKNDFDYLVLVSAKLPVNAGFLGEFRRRFHITRFLYQLHSNGEDEVVFPALEAKGKLQNISHSYSIDHKLEREIFSNISIIIDEISELHASLPSETSHIVDDKLDLEVLKYRKLCVKVHCMCKTMSTTLGDHINHEEVELWPLFTECFSYEEQEKIIGCMLGRTRAEALQAMIPWLMSSLTPVEQDGMMSIWSKVTKNTMFDEWLAAWWEGSDRHDMIAGVEESDIRPFVAVDPLEIVATYVSGKGYGGQEGRNLHDKGLLLPKIDFSASLEPRRTNSAEDKAKVLNGDIDRSQCSECAKGTTEDDKQRYQDDVKDWDEKSGEASLDNDKTRPMNLEDLEAAIRRVSRDTTLDSQKKSYIIQNIFMSRWMVLQPKPHQQVSFSGNDGEIPGQCPSYRDGIRKIFGCKHYKRSCKLYCDCCKQLFTCRYCHDEVVADHLMDRKSTTKMMCMKCLQVQPIGPTCCNISCNNLSMARYFCKICKLFEDEREIYHCPYCNLCRVGKGLGIDYFHCMNCNACMSKSLSVHICREKGFESNCPICHEDIFTSSSPVKALPCGHMMHSTCFQEYTCTHYTCPICSKSLGDMQVYFAMIDALLAEDRVPQEYSGQTQMILCNDCEQRGVAPFHWHYRKCPHCGSYNTRLF